MHPKILARTALIPEEETILFTRSADDIPQGLFSEAERGFIREQRKKKLEMVPFCRLDHWIVIQFLPDGKDEEWKREKCRIAGDKIQEFLNVQKIKRVTVTDLETDPHDTLALLEGMALGGYQFLKYKTGRKDQHTLREIGLFSSRVGKRQLTELEALVEGVTVARDLVNEPNSYLTATVFAREVEKLAGDTGITTEVLSRKKLEALKMGGLLAVNSGSHDPPLFLILEYKPARPVNKKPVVLVGKGIMYDTGGMNLKTESHMENMKNDMAGAAAVAGTILAAARAKYPCHVIGLIPATDNRPGPRAMVSGDIIRMHNGMTVEVINTDAEGRLILADALSYAKKYNPLLAIDLATLTGSAVRAVGKRAIAGMQHDARRSFDRLKRCGSEVYERIVELPLWEDYGEELKSELADIKNLGGKEAGAITAGKFLQAFTGYPWIHLDIAGPAFLDKRDTYRGQGGTGAGVRLLLEFLKGMKSNSKF